MNPPPLFSSHTRAHSARVSGNRVELPRQSGFSLGSEYELENLGFVFLNYKKAILYLTNCGVFDSRTGNRAVL